jgi:DNA-binding Lrp family transcriptional regulator
MSQPAGAPTFMLLSNHGHALVAITEDADARLRDIAERLGITERAAQSIVNDLVDAGYVQRTRVGRRNTYTVDRTQPFPHPALEQEPIGTLLSSLVAWTSDDDPNPAQPTTAGEGDSFEEIADAAAEVDTDEGLDRLTSLAAWLVHTPVCFVSLIRDETELITSGVGVPDELMRRELPLDRSICQHVISGQEPLVVFDTLEDPVLADNPAVLRYGLRACVGLPLVTSGGITIGSMCAADTQPRRWTEADVRMLTSLAMAAASQVEIGILSRGYRDAANRYRTLLETLPDTLIMVFDAEYRLEIASATVHARNSHRPGSIIGRTLDELTTPEEAAALRAHYQAALHGERHRFHYRNPAGLMFDLEVVPLNDADGSVGSFMVVGRERSDLPTAAYTNNRAA